MAAQRFRDRTILVTGAASGIGRAVATRLHEEGARVVLADRNEAGLMALRAALGRDSTHPVIYDAGDAASCMSMVQEAREAFGALHAVINNAGTYRKSHFAEITPDAWASSLAVNLSSHMWVSQAALPALRETRGNLVMTASTAAQHGNAYAAPYAAAKGGLVALVMTMAAELSPMGIRVNAVCPGKVNTAIGEGLEPLRDAEPGLLVRPPKLAGRTDGGSPEDLAGAYAFLASDDATYVSGAVLTVDGAQHTG